MFEEYAKTSMLSKTSGPCTYMPYLWVASERWNSLFEMFENPLTKTKVEIQMTDKLRIKKMNTKFLTPAQFGRRHGVSRVTVLTWRKRGFVVMAPDGKRVDVAASEILLADRPQKYRGGSAKALHADADPSLADSQRRKEAAQAALAELKLAEASGKLLERDEAYACWAGIILGVRQRMLGWPSKAAFLCPVLTATDREALDQMTRDDLQDASLDRGFEVFGGKKIDEGKDD
jgi:hypothetical protein